MTINRDEWLTALHAVTNDPLPETDAVTVREFAEMLGIGRATADRKLAKLVAAGRATETTKLVRRTAFGVVRVPAYRLIHSQAE